MQDAVLIVLGDGGHKEQAKRVIKEVTSKLPNTKFVAITENIKVPLDIFEVAFAVPDFRKKDTSLFQAIVSAVHCSWCAFFALRRLRKSYRIRVAISTGPGLAIPVLFYCKCLKVKTVFFESWSRFYDPSLSGRVCARFVDRLYYQNKSMAKYYLRGEWSGRL